MPLSDLTEFGLLLAQHRSQRSNPSALPSPPPSPPPAPQPPQIVPTPPQSVPTPSQPITPAAPRPSIAHPVDTATSNGQAPRVQALPMKHTAKPFHEDLPQAVNGLPRVPLSSEHLHPISEARREQVIHHQHRLFFAQLRQSGHRSYAWWDAQSRQCPTFSEKRKCSPQRATSATSQSSSSVNALDACPTELEQPKQKKQRKQSPPNEVTQSDGIGGTRSHGAA